MSEHDINELEKMHRTICINLAAQIALFIALLIIALVTK